MNARRKSPISEKYVFGFFFAFELLMSFTFLGYIHIEPISVTIAYIPVLLAGCLLGVWQSTVLGCVFGLASMYKASASYVVNMDAIFSPLTSGAPIQSILLSVGIRTLFGFLIGVAYALVRNKKHAYVWIAIVSALSTVLQSGLTTLGIIIMFPEQWKSVRYSGGIYLSNLWVAIFCMLITVLLWRLYRSNRMQTIFHGIDSKEANLYPQKKEKRHVYVFLGFIVLMSIFSTIYFVNRMFLMLAEHGIQISDRVGRDILHLQVQFLIASLALSLIGALLLGIVYRYMHYREYLVEIDSVTGIMGRKIFLRCCDSFINDSKNVPLYGCWFLVLDIDDFKSINDELGHIVGDRVLSGVGEILRRLFEEDGIVGRIGGDEFAILIEKGLTQQMLEQKLTEFLQQTSEILEEKKITCSIGARRFYVPCDMSVLFVEADRALYQAKEKGKACFVIDAQ